MTVLYLQDHWEDLVWSESMSKFPAYERVRNKLTYLEQPAFLSPKFKQDRKRMEREREREREREKESGEERERKRERTCRKL